METLNLELSKKLNEAGLLDNIDTEYVYEEDCGSYYLTKTSSSDNRFKNYKTLTLQEALKVFAKREEYGLTLTYSSETGNWICAYYDNDFYCEEIVGGFLRISGKTPIEALEKMIELLFDKNLIGQNTKN